MHRNKNGWKIEQLWKIGKNKNQILALFLTKTPPDDWPDALDCLTLGLVANKLGKIRENLLLTKGLTFINLPLCHTIRIFFVCKPELESKVHQGANNFEAPKYCFRLKNCCFSKKRYIFLNFGICIPQKIFPLIHFYHSW